MVVNWLSIILCWRDSWEYWLYTWKGTALNPLFPKRCLINLSIPSVSNCLTNILSPKSKFFLVWYLCDLFLDWLDIMLIYYCLILLYMMHFDQLTFHLTDVSVKSFPVALEINLAHGWHCSHTKDEVSGELVCHGVIMQNSKVFIKRIC